MPIWLFESGNHQLAGFSTPLLVAASNMWLFSSASNLIGEPVHKDQLAFCKLLLLHSYGVVDDYTNLQKK